MKTAPSARLPKDCAAFQAQLGDLKMRAGSSVVSKFLRSDNRSGQTFPFRLLLNYYPYRSRETERKNNRPGRSFGAQLTAYCLLLSAFCLLRLSATSTQLPKLLRNR